MSEFVKGDVKKLREYIKNAVMEGDNSEILYEIDNDRIKPSKKPARRHCGNARKQPRVKPDRRSESGFERIVELS